MILRKPWNILLFRTIRFDKNNKNSMDIDDDHENVDFVDDAKDDFDIDLPDEDDDALWQLDDRTKYLIGDYENRYEDGIISFSSILVRTKKHMLLQRVPP